MLVIELNCRAVLQQLRELTCECGRNLEHSFLFLCHYDAAAAADSELDRGRNGHTL